MANNPLLKKSLIHLGMFAFAIIVIVLFLKPQVEGYTVNQSDTEQWRGASHEAMKYHDNTGDYALWTNSMFGGMPTEQIFLQYPGNIIKGIYNFYFETVPQPMGAVLLHFISFYIFCMLLRIRPLIALLGGLAFSFATYEIIVLQAGHITKANAVAFLPALLGAFIYAYRTNRVWGIILSGVFLAFELASNHLQITYYFAFALLFLGIYFLVEAVREKKLRDFFITSAGIIAMFGLAVLVNIGNIMLTADYASNTIRGKNDVTLAPTGLPDANQSKGLDKDYITNWSYGKGETFNLLSPYVKGYGSMAFGNSPKAEEIAENYSGESAKNILEGNAYWGDQPGTSGPAYLGIVCILLAVLGLVFLRDRIKWPLFAVTVLAVMLSWGKNFMGLTDFFINNIPGYDKFRAVTIILIIAEVTVPVLAVIFLDRLITERERLIEKRKQVLIALGVFFVFLLGVKVVGLNDGYMGEAERQQLATFDTFVMQQLKQMDPAVVKQQYGVDVNNPAQMKAFADQQLQAYEERTVAVKEVRAEVFHSSMNRSLGLTFFASLLIVLFLFSGAAAMSYVLMGGMLVLTMIDLIPVAYNYLGTQELGSDYKYWVEKGLAEYPISASEADEAILQAEIAKDPSLAATIRKAEQEGARKADELGYSGITKRNLVDSYRFSALNFHTNYRVFDINGNFNSSRASYLHKSLGGYHGAKLRNIQNLISYHVSRSNNAVFNMMNVRYFIQEGEKGITATPNPEALGNAWLVKRVEKHATPDAEIRALGNEIQLTNSGPGTFLVNGEAKKEASVFGGEKLQYVVPGKDTVSVPLANGLREGTEAIAVMDVNGVVNLVPAMTLQADTAKSFTSLVTLKIANEFVPKDEAVMLESEAAKLKAKSFSGEGTIRLTSYSPDKLTYSADLKGNQLAVFSEIYYPLGWKAYVDGKEVNVLKVDYLLRGLELSGGKHKIEFVYGLPKYDRAQTIARISSILFLLLIGGAAFMDFRRRKKTPTA